MSDMTIALLSAWAVVLAVLTLALITAPRWAVRSFHRHRLWRHRDHVVDLVLDGTLPRHPAVRRLIDDIESSIETLPKVSLVRAVTATLSLRSSSEGAQALFRERATPCSNDGLTKEQCKVLDECRHKLAVLRTGLVLLGSWVGVTVVAVAFLRLRFGGAHGVTVPDPTPDPGTKTDVEPEVVGVPVDSLRTAAARATDHVVEDTKLGQAIGRTTAALEPVLSLA